MKAILEALLTAKTSADLERIAVLPGYKWVPFGDRELNFPTIHIGHDPGDAIIERVTNGIDGMLELKQSLCSGSELPASPREAAERHLGVPSGRLTFLTDTSRRRQLAENLTVTLRSGSDRKRPTVVVQDRGIGQHPADFPGTLLSLNVKNKVNRPDQMGAFGQGGASTFAFTDIAAFVARRAPHALRPGQTDLVGWTVIRLNELDDTHKYGMYEYLTIPAANGEFVVPSATIADLPEAYRNWHGCYFVAADYRFDRFYDTTFHPSNSLWWLLNVGLYDPVMPILIRDEREKAVKENPKNALAGIVVSGNATRLAEDKRDKIEYSSAYQISLGEYGTAILRVSVLKDTGDPKKDWERMSNYTSDEQAVVITLNGQRQDTMRRDVFARLGLLSLAKALIVQVDCDDLSRKAKRELFSSSRQHMKAGEIRQRLEQGIKTALASDSELKAMDAARKQRALARQSETESKRIRDWLKDAIKGLRKGKVDAFKPLESSDPSFQLLGQHVLLDETGQTTVQPPSEKEVSAFGDAPTYLIARPAKVRIPERGTGVARLLIDAADDYVSPEPGVGKASLSLDVTKGTGSFAVSSHSPVRAGTIRVAISATASARPGDQGRIIATIPRSGDLPLMAEIDLEVIAAPQRRARPAGSTEGTESGPDVKALDRSEWAEMSLDPNKVAEVEIQPDNSLVIYVQREYPILMERIRRERIEVEQIVAYQSKFVASIALSAWLQMDRDPESEMLSESQKDAELRRAAEVFVFTQWVARM